MSSFKTTYAVCVPECHTAFKSSFKFLSLWKVKGYVFIWNVNSFKPQGLNLTATSLVMLQALLTAKLTVHLDQRSMYTKSIIQHDRGYSQSSVSMGLQTVNQTGKNLLWQLCCRQHECERVFTLDPVSSRWSLKCWHSKWTHNFTCKRSAK